MPRFGFLASKDTEVGFLPVADLFFSAYFVGGYYLGVQFGLYLDIKPSYVHRGCVPAFGREYLGDTHYQAF